MFPRAWNVLHIFSDLVTVPMAAPVNLPLKCPTSEAHQDILQADQKTFYVSKMQTNEVTSGNQ